jgi:hypothetical protein
VVFFEIIHENINYGKCKIKNFLDLLFTNFNINRQMMDDSMTEFDKLI